MSLTAELQSLAALKAQGTLTEQEFAQAKAEVIAKYGGTSTATPVTSASKTSATGLMHCKGCGKDISNLGKDPGRAWEQPHPENPHCSECDPWLGHQGC